MQTVLHYFLHLVFPLAIAWVFFNNEWKNAYLLLLLTMLVDLDHLLASPIFDADRCSINFHPLHSYYAMVFYVGLLFLRKPFRILGIGLLLHMFTDLVDCLLTYQNCKDCLATSPLSSVLQVIFIW
ncbi:DUF6122 family protein [Nonlabens sp.]|uniref:DUF6122 family protein n=1 Tax=Nonlabens sp. TaxID=1888209 RepID=UPI0025D4EFAF|nr:DUF6122 family protein [Nonlabens sp.]